MRRPFKVCSFDNLDFLYPQRLNLARIAFAKLVSPSMRSQKWKVGKDISLSSAFKSNNRFQPRRRLKWRNRKRNKENAGLDEKKDLPFSPTSEIASDDVSPVSDLGLFTLPKDLNIQDIEGSVPPSSGEKSGRVRHFRENSRNKRNEQDWRSPSLLKCNSHHVRPLTFIAGPSETGQRIFMEKLFKDGFPTCGSRPEFSSYGFLRSIASDGGVALSGCAVRVPPDLPMSHLQLHLDVPCRVVWINDNPGVKMTADQKSAFEFFRRLSGGNILQTSSSVFFGNAHELRQVSNFLNFNLLEFA